MRILLKYTLKSIGEKKLRSFLIIFAIALSGALFLASSRLSVNMEELYKYKLTSDIGDVDIVISPNEDSPSWKIDPRLCRDIADDTNYNTPMLYTSGEYKEAGGTQNYIDIQAYNFDEYEALYETKIVEGSLEQGDVAYPLVISENGAAMLGLGVDDTIMLSIEGKRIKVTVVAIVANKGMFTNEQGYVLGLMPFDVISKLARTNGKGETIQIQLKEGVDTDTIIKQLQEIYPKYDVQVGVDEEELAQELSSITAPFMLMTMVVVFMSIYIIYSSFKVIMMEKLPAIGTFRSIGASKSIMNAVLLMESGFYGIVGGIFACLLGYGGLYGLSQIMAMLLFGDSNGMNVDVPMTSFITTFLLGFIMALASTIIPIISVSKISLKDIILNNRPHKSRKYLKGTCTGIMIITIGFILPNVASDALKMIASIAGLLLVIVGVIMILPLFVLITSQVLGYIFRVIFGNVGELATKNIKKNKSVLNSMTLITIGISILLMISTITQNIQDQLLDFYENTVHCDLLASMGEMDERRIKMVERLEGVDHVLPLIDGSMEIEAWNDTYFTPMAIDTKELNRDLDFGIKNEQELLTKLQEGRNVILTDTIKKHYNVEIGDKITLPFERRDREYTVIGFIDTMMNDGHIGLLPLKYYKQDSGEKYYSTLYITAKEGADVDALAVEIQELASRMYTWSYTRTVTEMAASDREGNMSLMGIISIFAILAMVIGIIGVINNLMISFIERKQNIAMLRSIGMSKMQVLKMIFVEGLGSGFIGALGGVVGGGLVCIVSNGIMDAMQVPIAVTVEPSLFPRFLIGGMLITVIGSIIPARGSSKLNIIEAIKYE